MEILDHDCKSKRARRSDGYGGAINDIYHQKELDAWFAGNSEYGTEIYFCPFCGERLLTIKQQSMLTVESPLQKIKPDIADPDCWFCEGTGKYKGDPCLICLEPLQ